MIHDHGQIGQMIHAQSLLRSDCSKRAPFSVPFLVIAVAHKIASSLLGGGQSHEGSVDISVFPHWCRLPRSVAILRDQGSKKYLETFALDR
jgi:hypothetical protein